MTIEIHFYSVRSQEFSKACRMILVVSFRLRIVSNSRTCGISSTSKAKISLALAPRSTLHRVFEKSLGKSGKIFPRSALTFEGFLFT